MRAIFLIISLNFFLSGFGQIDEPNPPNYNLIEREIKNPDSEFYYEKLLQRYRDHDTTLTQEEYRHLYYGYVFSDSYEPYWQCAYIDTLSTLYSGKDLTQRDCDILLKYASMCYDEFPFDLKQIKMIAYTYHLNGQEDEANLWSNKARSIIGAILSTGNGDKNNAWHVIAKSHEYEVIRSFGLSPTEQSLVEGRYDMIKLSQNQNGVTQYYFDVGRLLVELYMQTFDK